MPQPSRIADRYDGFLLGFALFMLRFDFCATRYPDYRTRIHDVLVDRGVDLQLPEAHPEFVAAADAFVRDVLRPLKAHSQELIDFFSLGADALRLMIERDEAGDVSLNDFRDICASHDLDADWLAARLQNPRLAELHDEQLVAEIMSTAYELAAVVVGALDVEPTTAFVILPFGQPFAGDYPVFHARALELAGLRPLRAWVGLTNEYYRNVLHTLIDRCGLAVADLSAEPGRDQPNLNVVHEVGLAQGMGKRTWFVVRAGEQRLPSNLIGSPMIEYDPGDDGWPEQQAVGVAQALLALEHRHREWVAEQGGD